MSIVRQHDRPEQATRIVTRPRLNMLFDAEFVRHEVLAVFAAPGSGKTLQAQEYAATVSCAVEWLTLERSDRNAATLRDRLPVVGGGATLVVIDNCEVLCGSPEAEAEVADWFDRLPLTVRTILLGRSEPQAPMARLMSEQRVARVTGEQLALDISETQSFLDLVGAGNADSQKMFDATHGWIAGVAFALSAGDGRRGGHKAGQRSGRHEVLGDYVSDALGDYVESELLAGLGPDVRDFLVTTSLLSTVSLDGAAALYGSTALSTLRRVRSMQLPITTAADRSLAYQPQFRYVLRSELLRRPADEVAAVRVRHARFLEESGSWEAAVDAWLSMDRMHEAAIATARAVEPLAARGAWTQLTTWLEVLGESAVSASAALTAARIRALHATRQIDTAQQLVRQLDAAGTLAEIVSADSSVVFTIGKIFQWLPEEGLRLMGTMPADKRAAGCRFALEVASSDQPAEPPAPTDWGECERMVSWGLLLQGRLDELLDMFDEGHEWPPTGLSRTPHPLLGLVWRGDLANARQLLDQVPVLFRAGTHFDHWDHLEAWLLLGEGEHLAAVTAAAAAVEHSARTGFGWERCFQVALGRSLLAIGRVDEARAQFASAKAMCERDGIRAYVEWADAFDALAALRSGESEYAAVVLRSTVASMRRSGRRLFLPFAGVYLAEAELRLGNLDAARCATRTAIDAAASIGAPFALEQALADVPGMLERLDGRIHFGAFFEPLAGGLTSVTGLGQHGSPCVEVEGEPVPTASDTGTRVTRTEPVYIEVQTFGDAPDIIVDGQPMGLKRLKVVELAALLSLRRQGVPRSELLTALVPDSDRHRGGNYFRQIVHRLRCCTGVSLERTPTGALRWPDDVLVDAVDVSFERVMKNTAGAGGNDRFDQLHHELRRFHGAYLNASDLEWAEARRYQLDVQRTAALVELSRLGYELGRWDDSRSYAQEAITADPYCEEAYRTLLRLEAAAGSPHAVMATYRRLTNALTDLSLEPDRTTLELLRELRRSA